MENGTADLARRARSIFDQLGYTVVGDGTEFRAERDWKSVRVEVTTEPAVDAIEGLCCFVTPSDAVASLRQRLDDARTDEWAIIAVDGEDHEIVRAPPGPGSPV